VEKIHHTWSYGNDAMVLDDFVEENSEITQKLSHVSISHNVIKYVAYK